MQVNEGSTVETRDLLFGGAENFVWIFFPYWFGLKLQISELRRI